MWTDGVITSNFISTMFEYFSVGTTLFTIWGYAMSPIEFVGTIFNVLCVWLIARNNIWNWPIGLLGTVLFGMLFWQIALYSDFFEQIYFFITGILGWWLWLRPRDERDRMKGGRRIVTISSRARLGYVFGIFIGTFFLGALTTRLPDLWPTLFPEPTSLPYLDAFTTVMSFAATILIMRKELECWVLWIIVDIIGIGLYWVKDVKLVAVLYVVFLILATRGFINWYKLWKTGEAPEATLIPRS